MATRANLSPAPNAARAGRPGGCALALAGLGFAGGCVPGTGGRAVEFEVALALPGPAGAVLETSTGWQVELEDARVALGPIYVHERPSFWAAAGAAGPLAALGRGLGEVAVPSAHAHAGDGFFDGGALRGEHLGQVVVDLLARDVLELGPARGIAGPAESVSVILDPVGPTTEGDRSGLMGAQARLAGLATRGDELVPFVGVLQIPDLPLRREVNGIPLDASIDDGGRLTIEVRVAPWLDQAHFDRLEALDDQGRFVIGPLDQPGIAWDLAIRGVQTFAAAWEPGR